MRFWEFLDLFLAGMSFPTEGGSISRLPQLDGSNYPYWMTRMKAFIKTLDEKAWRFVLTSWKHPTKKYGKGNVTLTLRL